jgi:hypothetical protein
VFHHFRLYIVHIEMQHPSPILADPAVGDGCCIGQEAMEGDGIVATERLYPDLPCSGSIFEHFIYTPLEMQSISCTRKDMHSTYDEVASQDMSIVLHKYQNCNKG